MNREQILDAFRTLSRSQGCYGRILRSLNEVKENDPQAYENYMTVLESKNFKDTVDLVMFYEGM